MKQKKLASPYLGHNPAEFIHSNKFHRTTAEAFRGVEYASAIEGYDELEDMKTFIKGMLISAPILIILTSLMMYVIMYYK